MSKFTDDQIQQMLIDFKEADDNDGLQKHFKDNSISIIDGLLQKIDELQNSSVRIKNNKEGELEDMVINNITSIHLARLLDNRWWLRVARLQGDVIINLRCPDQTIQATIESL